MKSKWRKFCGNRLPLEEEANALQDTLKRETSLVGYLKYQYDEQKSVLEANERTTSAFRDSTEGPDYFVSAGNQTTTSLNRAPSNNIHIHDV